MIIYAPKEVDLPYLGNNFYTNNNPKEIKVDNNITSVTSYKIRLKFGEHKIEVIFDENKIISDTSSMFSSCSNIMSLDLSNFNTSNVQNMNSMFAYCSGLISLDLSNFNTSNVQNMNNMFASCTYLKSLDLSNFNTSNVQKKTNIFYYCNSLEYINIFKFSGSDIFGSIPNINNIKICVGDNVTEESYSSIAGAKKSCIKLNIKFCLFTNNINYGLYNNTNIIELNKIDDCNFNYYMEYFLSFNTILYKDNKVLRMDSQKRTFDTKNILNSEKLESEDCKYIKENKTIDCNFEDS